MGRPTPARFASLLTVLLAAGCGDPHLPLPWEETHHAPETQTGQITTDQADLKIHRIWAAGPLQAVGDLTGDGIPDVLQASEAASNGRAWVCLIRGPVTSDAGPGCSSSYDSATVNDRAGQVADVGDVNGDGFRDLLVGAHGAKNDQGTTTGAAYLVYGPITFPGSRSIATAPVKFVGEAAGNAAGVAVLGPGDLTGDGKADLLIASFKGGAYGSGRVYLMAGPYAATNKLGGSATRAIFEWSGFGEIRRLELAGDQNGDGRPEIAVVGRTASGSAAVAVVSMSGTGTITTPLATYTGNGQVYRAALGTADLDGDGAQDLLVGMGYASISSPYRGAPVVHAMNGPLAGALQPGGGAFSAGSGTELGRSVAGLGDVNGDGYDDVLIGAPATGTSRGAAYLVYGPSAGGVAPGFAGPRLAIVGTQPRSSGAAGTQAGLEVGSAGDLNGDGRPDFWVGGIDHFYLFFGDGTASSQAAPQVSLTAPGNGSTVHGVIHVSATASDADGSVAKVTFGLPDGTFVDDTTSPFAITWDTATVPDGTGYTITAKAFDDLGAASAMAVRTVRVQNDACVNGTFASTDDPLPSGSYSGLTPVTSTLYVGGPGTVGTLKLTAQVNWYNAASDKLTLTAPDGSTYQLPNQSSGTITHLPITAFNGKVAAGVWKLTLKDSSNLYTAGQLQSWSLAIAGSCDAGGCVDGTFTTNDAPQPTYSLYNSPQIPVVSTTYVFGPGTVTSLKLSATLHWGASYDTATFTLIAPDGSSSVVASTSGNGLSNVAIPAFNGKVAQGTWKLKVMTGYGAPAGLLQSWSLRVVGTCTPTPCVDGTHAAGGLPLSIPDNSSAGTVSSLPVTGNGNVASLSLSLNVVHPYKGDLKVTLISPAGTAHVVHNQTGGSADDVVLTGVPVAAFGGQPAAGTWKLKAQDLAGGDVGQIESWSLTFAQSCVN